MNPFAATRADALPAGPPTVSPPAQRGVAGHSAAIRTATSMKEPCAGCSCTDWQQAHFTQGGRLLCELCWQGQRPATAMPPTPEGRAQLELWCQPHRGAL
jgi:hypothetical protein